MTKRQSDTVSASPTKRFFVSMLTRDIELPDAVLDLLDNCIDGVLRTKGYSESEKRPYKGFWARLDFDGSHFSISDNCGGISRELAEKSAFMLGRPLQAEEQDEDLPTVGMYGIGMKRAIFKMGRYAEVTSRTSKEAFQVTIPESWFSDEKTWDLPIETLKRSTRQIGTTVMISHLDPGVARRFAPTGDFEDLFRKAVAQQYSLIIAKGFEVFLNGTPVTPAPLVFRTVDLDRGYKDGIAPYMFRGLIDGVHVDLKVGFYRTSVDEDELEDEQQTPSSADEAGWTVVCNDRVVLYRDKTRLTGWGEGNVPSYHNQFIAIAGIVHFRSNDAFKLPVTTTKRGIDAGSQIYLEIKDRMRDGLKRFTNFTYKLKKDKTQKDNLFKETKRVNESILTEMGKNIKWKKDPKIKGGEFFSPNLPQIEKNDQLRRISFFRPKDHIRKLSNHFFDDPEVGPSTVGEKCFDEALRRVTK